MTEQLHNKKSMNPLCFVTLHLLPTFRQHYQDVQWAYNYNNHTNIYAERHSVGLVTDSEVLTKITDLYEGKGREEKGRGEGEVGGEEMGNERSQRLGSSSA